MENILHCPCGSDKPFNECCQLKYKSLHINPNINIKTASQYDLWAKARVSLWFTMNNQLNKMPTKQIKNIIIFGAGSCKDLPIDFICDIFEEVVLVDINDIALQNAKKYIPTHLQDKVTNVVMDVTGLINQFEKEIICGNINSFEKGIEYLNEISDKLPEIILPKEIVDKMPFSFVMSDLILTQLCSGFLEKSSHLFNYEYRSYENIEIESFFDSIILQHLNLLHKVSSLDGRVIVLADTFTYGYESDGSKSLFNQITDDYGPSILYKSIDSHTLNQWYQRYIPISGSAVIQTMSKYSYQNLEFDTYTDWWWILSSYRRYFVVCYSFLPR